MAIPIIQSSLCKGWTLSYPVAPFIPNLTVNKKKICIETLNHRFCMAMPDIICIFANKEGKASNHRNLNRNLMQA